MKYPFRFAKNNEVSISLKLIMNKEWFIFKGTHHLGPFTAEEVADIYQKNEMTAQTLVWREGAEKWEPLSKSSGFDFLFPKEEKRISPIEESEPPPLPKTRLPEPPPVPNVADDDMPPPIPLDVLLHASAPKQFRGEKNQTQKKANKNILLYISFASVLLAVFVWFAINEKKASIDLHIKGLMPVYLEKLEMTATNQSPKFEMSLALSLDNLNLWASTNKSGEVYTVIKMSSIPKRVLGTESVALTVKGVLKDHVGKFSKMVLTKGEKFLPGEYHFRAEARHVHFLNSTFKFLSQFSFFKSLNETLIYEGVALIYPGTPREFEKKIYDYKSTIEAEMLKPFQDKLERIQTLDSLLNATSQNYLLTIENAKSGKEIQAFEVKYIKEISPLLQALVVKALELSKDPAFNEETLINPIAPYREQVLLGKQLGELASDMITKTSAIKKLTNEEKSKLKVYFEKRAQLVKLQIDLNIKKLDEQLGKLSK